MYRISLPQRRGCHLPNKTGQACGITFLLWLSRYTMMSQGLQFHAICVKYLSWRERNLNLANNSTRGKKDQSGDKLFKAASFSVSFFVAFRIQLFKGKFYYCDGPDVKNITTKTDCTNARYKWVRRKYNFDNLGQVKSSSQGFSVPVSSGWALKMYSLKRVQNLHHREFPKTI